MPRCNSCNRWAGIEQTEPEVNDLKYDDGHVTGTIIIENNCAECNQTLTRAEFEFDEEVEFAHECDDAEAYTNDPLANDAPEFEPNIDVERTEKEVPPKGKVRKKFYGVKATIKAVCSCGYETPEVEFTDEIQASSMDDAQ